MKFSVGDRVRVTGNTRIKHHLEIGEIGVVRRLDGRDINVEGRKYAQTLDQRDIELVSETTKRKNTMRKLYRLKKDSLEFDKGLVVMENCTDGTQDFTEVLQPHHPEHYTPVRVSRALVEKKGWWEEVKVSFTPVNSKPKKNGRKRVRAYQDKIEGEVEKTTPTHYLFRTPDGRLHRRLKKSCKEV